MKAIELYGTRVAPIVRKETARKDRRYSLSLHERGTCMAYGAAAGGPK